MILGYDWPRLHAALNDFPAALLLASVLFDLLGAVNKRESLKAAGFWTLIAGVIGTAAAVLAGNMAEDVVEHDDAAHAIMETHQTLGIIVLVLFALLALWRIVRRGVLSEKEQTIALTAGVIGVAILVYTAKLGGALVFDHALGIPSATMETIETERGAGHHQHGGEAEQDAPMPMPADTAAAKRDSVAAHRHDDGTEHPHPDTTKR